VAATGVQHRPGSSAHAVQTTKSSCSCSPPPHSPRIVDATPRRRRPGRRPRRRGWCPYRRLRHGGIRPGLPRAARRRRADRPAFPPDRDRGQPRIAQPDQKLLLGHRAQLSEEPLHSSEDDGDRRGNLGGYRPNATRPPTRTRPMG